MKTNVLAVLALRIALGAIFLVHGLTKLFVYTPKGTAAFFAAHGFPAWLAFPVMSWEILGGLLLIIGIKARWLALAFLPILAGALLTHWPNGFMFDVPKGGWEFPAFLALTILVYAAIADVRKEQTV
ncbi:MAG TPA: DoxX family protein [Thermoanaerobaculia bacterium]|jgi:putative oxidoreductase|nr:DoxX family protein [Thermoanaerobaculia bacterium]